MGCNENSVRKLKLSIYEQKLSNKGVANSIATPEVGSNPDKVYFGSTNRFIFFVVEFKFNNVFHRLVPIMNITIESPVEKNI